MKSKDEMVLWRMLRRVSGRIGGRVGSGRIWMRRIRFNPFRFEILRLSLIEKIEELLLEKGYEAVNISFDLLKKHPIRIYKLILQLME